MGRHQTEASHSARLFGPKWLLRNRQGRGERSETKANGEMEWVNFPMVWDQNLSQALFQPLD
jgi:hypothetical protein